MTVFDTLGHCIRCALLSFLNATGLCLRCARSRSWH
jgi:hypothetical protein